MSSLAQVIEGFPWTLSLAYLHRGGPKESRGSRRSSAGDWLAERLHDNRTSICSRDDSLGRLTGAFQRLAEALFERLPNASSFKRRKNVFQNLSESSVLWRNATGNGYENLLSRTEMSDLERLFQKRHVIEHCNGIVDQDYINKSSDTTYAVGQRLVITEAMVVRLAELVSKLAGELQKLV
jgi:hypothetical protein